MDFINKKMIEGNYNYKKIVLNANNIGKLVTDNFLHLVCIICYLF
jgi:hypothetical protein